MNLYEVHFTHSIQRESSGSFSTNGNTQAKLVVPAQSSSQARQMIEGMFGGFANCQVGSVIQK